MKKILVLIAFLVSCFYACEKSNDFVLPAPETSKVASSKNSVFLEGKPEVEITSITNDGIYTFNIHISTPLNTTTKVLLATEEELKKVVDEYNKFKSAKDYLLFPKENYTISGGLLKKGEKATQIELKIVEFSETLKQGNYILPLKLKVGNINLFHLVSIFKDTEYNPISSESKKPMPPGEYDCSNREEPIKMVAYVETNDYDIRNMGQFILKESKKPVFDMVILFAANMNYDAKAKKRVLFFNDKLQPILKDPEKYIKPLTDRGIKVIIDILPNHQGVGYANFQSYEEAIEFAQECKFYAEKLGVDGYDIDEEYAAYHNRPELKVIGEQSFLWFMRAMKEVMPDKLLTLYDYGHPLRASSVDSENKKVSDYIDYSWANYSENHSSFAGIPNKYYGKLSKEANRGLWGLKYAAEENLKDCYGLYMFFNINGRDIKNRTAEKNISEMTKIFYGEECTFSGVYHKGPKDY